MRWFVAGLLLGPSSVVMLACLPSKSTISGDRPYFGILGWELAISAASVVFIVSVVAMVIWPRGDGKTPDQRRQELDAFIRERNQREATKHANEVIYDEMLRQIARDAVSRQSSDP